MTTRVTKNPISRSREHISVFKVPDNTHDGFGSWTLNKNTPLNTNTWTIYLSIKIFVRFPHKESTNTITYITMKNFCECLSHWKLQSNSFSTVNIKQIIQLNIYISKSLTAYNHETNQMVYVIWKTLLGQLCWYLLEQSSLCNSFEDIKNNARVTVNNDFGVMSEAICQWFSRVTKSRVKIIGKSHHEWPKNRYSR